MTLIIGFHLGSFVLVGADTRVSYYPSGRLVYRDDQTKIQRTKLGFATGAGLANLLDPVKARLSSDGIEHTGHILDAIHQERTNLNAMPWISDGRVQEALNTTAWMFSYVARLADNDRPVLRLAVGTSDAGSSLRHVMPGAFWMFPPTDASQAQLDAWHLLVQESMKAPHDDGDPFGLILQHISTIAKLMTTVAAANKWVAPTFQLGVHALPFEVGISSFVGIDKKVEWDWGRDVVGTDVAVPKAL